ncbi:MAG: hypothetical protein ACXVBJ_02730 [Flavisolibacter sp.]
MRPLKTARERRRHYNNGRNAQFELGICGGAAKKICQTTLVIASELFI